MGTSIEGLSSGSKHQTVNLLLCTLLEHRHSGLMVFRAEGCLVGVLGFRVESFPTTLYCLYIGFAIRPCGRIGHGPASQG